jgi:CheY-like chemotaxis protein/chemotaxis signal transduction protein
MSQPHVLVVDDSEAILAFTRAVLSATYTVSTAKNGREGLELCKRLKPDLVLLDLSMPELDGEAVLERMRADRELSATPVIIISSEQARAQACVGRGAAACLIKPVRADELLALVGRTLDAAQVKRSHGSLAVLPLRVGTMNLAIPLPDVRHVLLQPATQPLPGGPSYLSSFFELFGESVCVLDLAARFGVEHTKSVVDRILVVVEYDRIKLALCVDGVHDPEAVLPADIQSVVPDGGELTGALRAVVRTTHGAMPVLHPPALLSRGLVRSLGGLIAKAASP